MSRKRKRKVNYSAAELERRRAWAAEQRAKCEQLREEGLVVRDPNTKRWVRLDGPRAPTDAQNEPPPPTPDVEPDDREGADEPATPAPPPRRRPQPTSTSLWVD